MSQRENTETQGLEQQVAEGTLVSSDHVAAGTSDLHSVVDLSANAQWSS